METVYLWRVPERTKSKWIATYARAEAPDRFQFTEGRVLVPAVSPAIFDFEGTSTELTTLDFLPNNVFLPVAGPRVLAVLRRYASADYQPVPAIVRTRDEVKSEAFTLLNLIRTVRALDHEKCVIEYIEGTSAIMGFRRLAYRADGLGSYHLAREAEYPGHILVSAKLVDELRGMEATGAAFMRPETIKL